MSFLMFCSTYSFFSNSDLKKLNVLANAFSINILIEFISPLISDNWTSMSLLFEGVLLLLLYCLDKSHLSCWFYFGF